MVFDSFHFAILNLVQKDIKKNNRGILSGKGKQLHEYRTKDLNPLRFRFLHSQSKVKMHLATRTLMFALLCLVIGCTLRHPAVNIYKANLTGPFNSEVKAYGNFDLNEPIWDEDKDQLKLAQKAIDDMKTYYHPSNFQRGPTYSLQYYRDSSLSTVLYVYFKQEQAKITKYYSIRADKGKLKGNTTYLGNETTFGVRPGYEMPQMNYSKVSLSNTSFVNLMLSAVGKADGSVFAPSTVKELKFWTFPEGQLYLLRCENSNKSSISFAMLNYSSTLTLIDSTYVPNYISTVDLDYVYINEYLKKLLSSLYRMDIIHSQLWMNYVVFLELFFDPLYENMMHCMLTLDHSYNLAFFASKFSQTLAIIPTFGALPYAQYMTSLKGRTCRYILLHEFNYTTAGENRFHAKSYFNNDDYDERMGNWTSDDETAQIKHSVGLDFNQVAISKLFKIDYPLVRVYSIEIRTAQHIYTHLVHIRERVGQFDVGNRYAAVMSNTVLIANQTFNPVDDKDVMKEIYHRKEYLQQLALYNYTRTVRDPTANQLFGLNQYCSVADGIQIALFMYQISYNSLPSPALPAIEVKAFMKDTSRNNVFFLGAFNIFFGDQNKYLDAYGKYFFYPRNYCSFLQAKNLTASQIDSFFSKAQSALLVDDNQQVTRDSISKVTLVPFENLKSLNLWIVELKNRDGRMIVRLNQKNGYEYFGFSKTSSSSSSSGNSTSVPMLGGGAGAVTDPSAIPKDYALKGSGDLSKDQVDAQFPYLLNLIFQNGEQCSKVTQISYYADPLSKMVAFMLACPSTSGSNAFQVVYLTQNKTYLYLGKTGLLVIPDSYWQVKTVTASSSLTQAIQTTVSGLFAPGITLSSVLFVNQIAFALGEFDFIGFQLSDGSKIQAQYLCYQNGTCQKLAVNVVEMGSGSTAGTGTGSSTPSSGGSSGTGSSSGANSATGSSNSGSGFGGIFDPFLPGVPTPPPPITYKDLSPTEVRSDPYLIQIYTALQPKLPPSLASLKVRSISKGTFTNGTISYRIFYGDDSKDTCFLTIFFEPSKRQVFYLALEEKPQIVQPSQSPPSAISPANSQVNGGSSSNTQALLKDIFTTWTLKQHPQLSGSTPSRMQIQISSNFATCTMYYLTASAKQYRVELRMDMQSSQVQEVGFTCI